MQFLNSNLIANPRYRNSNGPWLIDRDNRAVFDTWLGAGTLILGHTNENTCCPIKMLPEGMQISGKQKELLGNLVDFRVGGIGFQTSGSSAITRAIRLARAVTKREEILVVGRFWHGSEDELLFRENKLPISSGVPKLFHEKIIWFSSLEVALQKLDPTSTAAVIVEPYQGSDPSINTLSDLTQERRNYLQDNNILLICDEILNGFRKQYGSCSSSRIVNPDIVIFGKSIAGGIPIGLVVVSEEVLTPNITLPFWGGTFSASPIQLTCMFNTLDMLAVLDYQNIKKNFSALIKRLSHYCGEFDLQISTGCSFARINNRSISNARAFVDQDLTFEKFREYIQKKSIYIARNGLLFPSIFNIDDELPLN